MWLLSNELIGLLDICGIQLEWDIRRLGEFVFLNAVDMRAVYHLKEIFAASQVLL